MTATLYKELNTIYLDVSIIDLSSSLNLKKDKVMPLAKIIEVISEGKTLEEAVENAVKQASNTVQEIKQVYVKDFQAVVENNSITKYRVNSKITFLVKDKGN